MKIGGEKSNPPRDKGALVKSAAGGDPEACREIFDQTINMVFHILNIYTNGDRETAKDLSQTVFMKFFDNLGSLGPPYPSTGRPGFTAASIKWFESSRKGVPPGALIMDIFFSKVTKIFSNRLYN